MYMYVSVNRRLTMHTHVTQCTCTDGRHVLVLCYRWEERFEEDYCNRPDCWDDVFYPWSDAYRSISKESVLGSSLVLLLILVGYVIVVKPWKRLPFDTFEL